MEYLITTGFLQEKKYENEDTTKILQDGSFVSQARKASCSDFIEQCFIALTEEICLENNIRARTLFEELRTLGAISLSNSKNWTNDFKWFSLALDESAGAIITAQLFT